MDAELLSPVTLYHNLLPTDGFFISWTVCRYAYACINEKFKNENRRIFRKITDRIVKNRHIRIVWVVSAVVVPRRGMCPIRLGDTSTRFAYFHFDIENGQGITLNAVEKFRRRRGLGSTPRWSGTIYFARDLLMIYLRCEVLPFGMCGWGIHFARNHSTVWQMNFHDTFFND